MLFKTRSTLASRIRRLPTARFLVYNMGNPPEDLLYSDVTGWISTKKPDVIGFCEVGDRHALLRRIARATGYRLVLAGDTKPVAPGSSRLALLVAPHVQIESAHSTPISDRTFVGRWIPGAGSKKKAGYAEPKAILWIRCRIRGIRWIAGVTHLVPGAGHPGPRYDDAKALHHRQSRALVRWLAGRFRHTELMGDMNADLNSKLLSILRAARGITLSGLPSHGKESIDIHALKGAEESHIEALDGASDHRAIFIVARVKRLLRRR